MTLFRITARSCLGSRLAVAAMAALVLGVGACSGSKSSSGPNDTASEVSDDGPGDAGQRVSRTFSSYGEFTGPGTSMAGAQVDPDGMIRLTNGISLFETPFMWIPNSAEPSVSRIDTRTLEMDGPFPLETAEGEPCYNPSRTTVDIEGNVWLGCRGTSSYINRSELSSRSQPDQVDNKVMKLSRTDGHVMLSVRVGHAPRAMALDGENRLWIGCSVDDTIWALDGATGECLYGESEGCGAPPIPAGDFPYGAAVDQRGHLWVVSSWDDTLTEVDTATGALVSAPLYGPYPRETCGGGKETYGIAIDQLNNIWLGGWSCSDVVKIKGPAGINPADGQEYAAGQMIGSWSSGGKQTRGVAIDLDGNVWAANSATDTVTKLQGATGALLRSVRVGDAPIGVGVDAEGNAWAVNRGSNSVHRISGLDASVLEEIPVGSNPYSYSDMLGLSLRTIASRPEVFGVWYGTVDAAVNSPDWQALSWGADLPSGSQVQARFRCAVTEAELSGADWGPLLDEPGPVTCPVAGARFGQIEVRLVPSPAGASPVLNHISMVWVP